MSTAAMAVKDDWVNTTALIGFLAYQLTRGRLALVLGAGLSMPFGLPGWNDLLREMYANKCESCPTGEHKPEALAEYYRTKFCANDYGAFIEDVRRSLYKFYGDDKMKFSEMRKNETIVAVASLLMASRRGAISEVITFNFDDLLETYLRYHGYVVVSAFEDRHWSGNADVTVYHPHGMIPARKDMEFSKNIVFDQESYSAIVGNSNLPWRQLALTAMRRHTCLFLGLSGKDANLDSLLLEVKAQHVSKDQNMAYWGVIVSESSNAVIINQWENRGVFYKTIASYTKDLPEFLFKICQTAAEIAM